MVDYNLDLEDETWLENHPLFGTKRNDKIAALDEDPSDKDTSNIEENDTGDINTLHEDENSVHQTLPLTIFEQMIDLLEKATEFETIITLSQAERLILGKISSLKQIFKTSGVGGPTVDIENKTKKMNQTNVRTVINDVYNYWVQKRSKLRKPLLRKYWPITASNDTNPHLVFRPREKEKYKLRKKRQNDYDAYKKMKQLRSDFAKVRVLLDLICKREELNRSILDMQCDWFDQRIYDMTDTSGLPKESDRLCHDEIERVLDVPKYFDTASIDLGKKRKRNKSLQGGVKRQRISPVTVPGNTEIDTDLEFQVKTTLEPVQPTRVVADQDNPPLFLHPLETRESYTTTWENAVPFVTSYENSHPTPTYRFRHRPRVGRGGRIIIDRFPRPGNPDIPPANVFISGNEATLHGPNDARGRLLELLPEPLNHRMISRRIEEIAVAALSDDDRNTNQLRRTSSLPSVSDVNTNDENDGEEILVKINDWMETDEQLWGDELSCAIGPV